jgi:hypothetical protein
MCLFFSVVLLLRKYRCSALDTGPCPKPVAYRKGGVSKIKNLFLVIRERSLITNWSVDLEEAAALHDTKLVFLSVFCYMFRRWTVC